MTIRAKKPKVSKTIISAIAVHVIKMKYKRFSVPSRFYIAFLASVRKKILLKNLSPQRVRRHSTILGKEVFNSGPRKGNQPLSVSTEVGGIETQSLYVRANRSVVTSFGSQAEI